MRILDILKLIVGLVFISCFIGFMSVKLYELYPRPHTYHRVYDRDSGKHGWACYETGDYKAYLPGDEL